MIRSWSLENWIVVEPLHGDFNNSQNKHIWSCEPGESVSQEPDEFKSSGDEATSALSKLIQVAFGIWPEVEETDKETAHKEEGVDAEGSVGDSLKKKPLLDHSSEFHVVWVLEDDDASMAQDYPCHRNYPETMNCTYCIPANATIANGSHIGANWEG